LNTKVARLRYHGTGGSLFGLVLVNGLLTIITLGFYSFWAKNKVREFHYSHTELDGDRFAYHGTGGELLSGALKASGIMIVLLFVLGIVAFTLEKFGLPQQQAVTYLTIAFYVLFALLAIVAVHGARRYRLSRSSWRGIRFSYRGNLGAFFGMIVRGTVLSILTLTLYSPFFQNQRRAFLVNSSRFGSEPFMYDADGKELFGAYIKALLLTIPTLGVYWIWYSAFRHRYFWSNTAMRGARFRSSVTGERLFVLHLTNALLVLFTLGIAMPWAITRTHEFWCDNVLLQGTVDWATIEQRAQAAGSAAEGLAEGFDVDVGIGM
jgi:uncharacterized membrane protein YjgN (DUF898 family)